MYNEKDSNFGVYFMLILTIVLVILKLTGYLNVHWIIIFTPIWFPLFITIMIFIIVKFGK